MGDREEPRIAMQFSFLWTHLGLCAHVLGVHKIGTETERKMSLKTKNPDYVSNVRTYIRTAIIVSGSRTCGPNDGSSDSLMMATLSRCPQDSSLSSRQENGIRAQGESGEGKVSLTWPVNGSTENEALMAAQGIA